MSKENNENEFEIKVDKVKKSAARQTTVDVDSAPEPDQIILDAAHKVREDRISRRSERVHAVLAGSSAATAANYGVVFMATDRCFVREVYEFHTTKGTDSSNVGLNIEKLTGTTAPDSGTEILSSDLSLKGSNNTMQEGTPVADRASRTLERGDRLCLKDSGTLTSLAGVYVLIVVEYIN